MYCMYGVPLPFSQGCVLVSWVWWSGCLVLVSGFCFGSQHWLALLLPGGWTAGHWCLSVRDSESNSESRRTSSHYSHSSSGMPRPNSPRPSPKPSKPTRTVNPLLTFLPDSPDDESVTLVWPCRKPLHPTLFPTRLQLAASDLPVLACTRDQEQTENNHHREPRSPSCPLCR